MEKKELVPNLGKEKQASVTKWETNVEWTITVVKLRSVASVVANECVLTPQKHIKEQGPGLDVALSHGWARKGCVTVVETCVGGMLTAREVSYAVSMAAKKNVSYLVCGILTS